MSNVIQLRKIPQPGDKIYFAGWGTNKVWYRISKVKGLHLYGWLEGVGHERWITENYLNPKLKLSYLEGGKLG